MAFVDDKLEIYMQLNDIVNMEIGIESFCNVIISISKTVLSRSNKFPISFARVSTYQENGFDINCATGSSILKSLNLLLISER